MDLGGTGVGVICPYVKVEISPRTNQHSRVDLIVFLGVPVSFELFMRTPHSTLC
jgi:hypothetical protein